MSTLNAVETARLAELEKIPVPQRTPAGVRPSGANVEDVISCVV